MAPPISVPTIPSERSALPSWLLNVCFVLFVINASFFPTAYFAHWWIFDEKGLGIPTDFVNVWSAGRLALDGQPAQAWDWDIQKQVQVAVLGQSYQGNFAWHYPPPFLFVASLLAHFPYATAFIGWALASLVPYLAVMRAIVGRPFGWLLAAAFPVVLTNALVGQNGFLTASLIGGTLYFMPMRPVLSGVCLGLLSYKPQYGLLFPLVLIAASQWTVFVTAAVVAIAMAFGPAAGLELVEALTSNPTLKGYHLLPSVRGDLLAKLGRAREASAEFERAAGLTRNARERALLLERASACASGSESRP